MGNEREKRIFLVEEQKKVEVGLPSGLGMRISPKSSKLEMYSSRDTKSLNSSSPSESVYLDKSL